jgi:hypothetical protein
MNIRWEITDVIGGRPLVSESTFEATPEAIAEARSGRVDDYSVLRFLQEGRSYKSVLILESTDEVLSRIVRAAGKYGS